MHVVFRSLLKIYEYAGQQACKQLQCNKAKLSEPASINGLHMHRALASQIKCTLDENIGGHNLHCYMWFTVITLRFTSPARHGVAILSSLSERVHLRINALFVSFIAIMRQHQHALACTGCGKIK